MAKADYIRCDRCDCKVVYDAEDTIKDGLQALGLGDTPILCKDCRATPPALSSPALAVPMGWKLVPIIPSTDMAIIGGDLIEAGGSDLCSENVYAAMLKAAPPAPVAATATQEEALTDALTAENERLKEEDEREGVSRLIAIVGALTGAPMDDLHGYTLADCVAMLEEHEQEVAGIGWQIGLTGETQRADRAEEATARHAASASRHERLWRAAMRGAAKHRAALSASQERERALREALRKCISPFAGYAIQSDSQAVDVMKGFFAHIREVDGIARAALQTKEDGNGR
ncbi:hypothetical protein M5E06_17530 [Azospirillum sp. A1-3]|uniref:hypothetical protein n=1 Tax=Azospirillum sp. A1-3 TaxID=185874 RepID=UPI0020779365|nr:hypothetical protein [Azospirillum sp. A1-3]MCM8735936.1 hypothetical protein [Azospirillum sp. A1-3]